MKRKVISLLWMSLVCQPVFTVSSLGCAESEISSAGSESVFLPVIDEYRAAIHDPHYDSNFKDSFFSYEWRDYVDNPHSEPAYSLIVNCTPESGHGTLQLPCIVDSESATWTGKVHDIPTL